jgi:hypothetical protein
MQMSTQKYEQIVVIGKSLLDTVQCNQLISKHDNPTEVSEYQI